MPEGLWEFKCSLLAQPNDDFRSEQHIVCMSTRGAGSNIYVRARVRRQKKRLFFLASLSWLAFPTSRSLVLSLSLSLSFSFSFSIGPFHCLTPPWLAPPLQLNYRSSLALISSFSLSFSPSSLNFHKTQ